MLSSNPFKKTKVSQNTNPFAKDIQEATNKRTRSQFYLAEFQFSLDRSPLKDARKAMRKANKAFDEALGHSSQPALKEPSSSSDSSLTLATNQERSLCVDVEPHIDDELLLSPKKSSSGRTSMKRSSSPSFDAASQIGPAPSKRVKVSKVRSVSGPLDAFFAPKLKSVDDKTRAQIASARTVAASSEGVEAVESAALGPSNTALEVPKTPKVDREIPHIDFSTHTPSPRKRIRDIGSGTVKSSPLKSGRSFSEGALQHEEGVQSLSQIQENDQRQQQTITDDEPKTSASAPEALDSTLSMDVDTTPTEVPLNVSQADDLPHITLPIKEATNEQTCADTIKSSDDALNTTTTLNPSLLLTPITPRPDPATRKDHPIGQTRLSTFFTLSSSTPAQSPAPAKKSHVSTESSFINASMAKSGIPVAITTRPTVPQQDCNSGEQTTSTAEPRPSAAPKPISQGGRKAKRLPMQPIIPRTTRATALRLKKLQKNDPGRQASPSKVTFISSSLAGPSCPQDHSRATTCPPESPVKVQQTNAGEASSEQDKERVKQRKPFLLTKPSSLSPEKRQSTSSKASYIAPLPNPDFFPPPVTDPDARARTHSALNNLSSALDKLTVPPPPKPAGVSSEEPARRPSTSMGFTRDISTSPSLDPRPFSRASKDMRQFLPPPSGPRVGPKPPMHFNFGVSGSKKPFPNLGPRGPFVRPIQRMKASRKTTLETVQGSPVKGAAVGLTDTDDAIDNADDPEFVSNRASSRVLTTPSTSGVHSGVQAGVIVPNVDTSGDVTTPDLQSGGLKKISALNSSRRASMAFSTLSRTLSEQELLTPKETSPKEQNRSLNGSQSVPLSSRLLRSSSTRSPADVEIPPNATDPSSQAGPSTAPAAVCNGVSDVSRTSGAYVKKSSSNRSKMPGSLDILDKCTIYVDVRTDEGEDAGALFVDMLRGLGAKILARVGQSCTHIVFKNGLSSTVTRYKILDEPRPFVIGIGWVVECVEKRERVDESRFQVDIDGYNVSGTGKRRRSFLPKHLALLKSPGGYNRDDTDQSRRDVDISMSSSEADSASERSPLTGSDNPALALPLEAARRRSILLTGSMKPMAR